jgi:hypothetical protein
VSYGGETRDVEFINRHWYWLNWDNQRGKDGAYTINSAYDFIIAPKEYGLGTKEDHYQEEGETTSNTASKNKENSGSDEDSTLQDNKQTPAANSPVHELARSLTTYIVRKETKELVEATASLSINT